MCRKYGLSVIQTNGGKGMHYSQWQAEREGKPTWRTAIRMDIRETAAASFTWKQFLAGMEKKGYVWRPDRKYLALKAPGMERYIRMKSLGKDYTEDAVRQWILTPGRQSACRADKRIVRPAARKRTGLQALYYSYLYRMGVSDKRPKRIPYQIRSDIRRLDQRIAQMEFLEKHGITTREQLEEYQAPLEEKAMALVKERQRLYRKEPETERIREIGEELKPLRKEIRMCVRILQHSREMEERMEQAEHKQHQNKQEKQENKHKRTDRKGER